MPSTTTGRSLVADQDGVARPVVRDERTQGTEVRGVDTRAPLHFHRDLAVSEHEVDLEAALRPPEVDPVVELLVGAVSLDLHQDEVLERPAERLTPLLGDAPARQSARHTHVEQVELRSFADDLSFLAPLPRLDESAEQRVDEDLVVLLHGLRVDAAVPRDVGVVGEVAVGVTHRLEEAREGGHVAGEPLVEDLLLQIVHDVGLK